MTGKRWLALGAWGMVLASIAAREARGAEPTDAPAKVRRLLAVLENPDGRRDPVHAILDLGQMGAEARDAVPTLIRIFEEGSGPIEVPVKRNLHLDAGWSLGKIGEAAPDVRPTLVPVFIRALDAADVEARGGAAIHLGSFGPDAQVATPALERVATKDPDWNVICFARDALEKIQGRPDEGTPQDLSRRAEQLIAGFAGADAVGRGLAAWKLGRIGRAAPEAREAIARALVKALADKDTDVRRIAVEAFGCIGLDSLAAGGPEARASIGAFERVAKEDPEGEVRFSARIRLVPWQRLQRALADLGAKEAEKRLAAVRALRQMAPEMPGSRENIATGLRQAVGDADAGVRAEAETVLRALGLPKAPPAAQESSKEPGKRGSDGKGGVR